MSERARAVQALAGIHHITALANDPRANVSFYQDVLGQRLVKRTVNFDDPNMHHLYYGDEIGSPGTILTFFPWPGLRRGRRGVGETAAVAYAVARDSLAYWRARLAAYDMPATDGGERFGQPVLIFEDVDGMPLELVGVETPPIVRPWSGGPVPAEHMLHGFFGVTLCVSAAEPTAMLLTDYFGYQLVDAEGQRLRFQATFGAPGAIIDLLVQPDSPGGRMGAGTVHHVAFRVPDEAAQTTVRERLVAAGLSVTPVRDRQYFRSIYFYEPGGVLFEIATDGPGMLIDETLTELGSALRLPPWLEPYRAEIAQALPALG